MYVFERKLDFPNLDGTDRKRMSENVIMVIGTKNEKTP